MVILHSKFWVAIYLYDIEIQNGPIAQLVRAPDS